MENLKRPVTMEEVENVIKSHDWKSRQDPMGFQLSFI